MVNWPPQMALLIAALLFAGASSKGGGAGAGAGAAGAGPLRSERDRSLNHPALRVVNRGEAVLGVRLEGPVRRDLLAPPGEVARTLLPAGEYRYEVRRAGRALARGRLLLRRGHRYHLEPAP